MNFIEKTKEDDIDMDSKSCTNPPPSLCLLHFGCEDARFPDVTRLSSYACVESSPRRTTCNRAARP